ncbi:hypothetical protein MBLNU13_g11379t1 [Cladosporium sp. NU13]
MCAIRLPENALRLFEEKWPSLPSLSKWLIYSIDSAPQKANEFYCAVKTAGIEDKGPSVSESEWEEAFSCMKCSSELLCLLSLMIINPLAMPVNHKRALSVDTPTLSFPCTGHRYGDMTEVCKTMCHGINCMQFPSEMYWDKRTDGDSPEALEVAEARRREAGCQIGNRCTKPPYQNKRTWECDEFPF